MPPALLHTMLRVFLPAQAMVEPVEQVEFSPFDRARAGDWHAVRARFARDADDVMLSIRDLVDTCFRKLRSVDAAAQLLHSFQRIQVRCGAGGGARGAPAGLPRG